MAGAGAADHPVLRGVGLQVDREDLDTLHRAPFSRQLPRNASRVDMGLLQGGFLFR